MSQAIDALIQQRLGFGCGRLKGGSDRKRSFELISTALHHGVRHFDVAPLYGMGAAEDVLGEALASMKLPVTVSTKVGIPRPQPSSLWKLTRRVVKPIATLIPGVKTAALRVAAPKERSACFEPGFMLGSFKDSLSRLKLSKVEVLFLHEPDLSLDMARVHEALAPLVESGLVRHLGSSTGASFAQLAPFGTAAQYRYDLAAETISSAAWEAQHGVLRFLKPYLVNSISTSPWIKQRTQDIVPGGDVDTAIGALCIAYVLQRCSKKRLIISSDNTARLGVTLSTVRSILGAHEWPVTVDLLAEAMRSEGTVR